MHSTFIQGCIYIFFLNQLEILVSPFNKNQILYSSTHATYVSESFLCSENSTESNNCNKWPSFVLPGNNCKMNPCQYRRYGLRSVLPFPHRAMNQSTVGSSLLLAYSTHPELCCFGVYFNVTIYAMHVNLLKGRRGMLQS